MAWIIVSANGEEIERRELKRAVVIGRATQCDVAVRDVLLSRTHCRLEPLGHGWRIVDLGSKNGTRVGWQRVAAHVLRDGDHLRMGRTRIEYHTGPFVAAAAGQRKKRADRLVRPADPHEALSGTVTDFVLLDEEEAGVDAAFYADRPYPQPRPAEPAAHGDGAVTQALLDDLASVGQFNPAGGGTAVAARPRTRQLPKRIGKTVYREVGRVAEMHFTLQADARHLPVEAVAVAPVRRRRVLAGVGLVAAALVGTGIVVMSLWLLTLAPT